MIAARPLCHVGDPLVQLERDQVEIFPETLTTDDLSGLARGQLRLDGGRSISGSRREATELKVQNVRQERNDIKICSGCWDR